MLKFTETYNKIITEYSEIQKRFQNITLAIVPGSFKPPHKGHWEMIMEYAQKADKVLVLISNVSSESNSNRPLSKSFILSLSKILNKYSIENDKALSIINNIKNNPDTLTLASLKKNIKALSSYLDENSDMYKELIAFMKKVESSIYKSIRYTASGNEISPKTSKQIFDIFIKAYGLDHKIIVEIADKASPMSSAVPIINDDCENCKIILGCSNKDNDASRWHSFLPSFNIENNNEFIEECVNVQSSISSTTIRNNISNLQRDWFPSNISDEDFNIIKSLLQ